MQPSLPATHARDSSSPPPPEPAKTRAEIRRARAARNRSSARRSRLRKKAETARDLEKAEQVELQNENLKQRVSDLRDRMNSLQRIVTSLGLADTDSSVFPDEHLVDR